jgi:hypothetical protein
LSRVAWVRVEGPLGGLFGHGVASTIGGAALDGLGVATSVTGATSSPPLGEESSSTLVSPHRRGSP